MNVCKVHVIKERPLYLLAVTLEFGSKIPLLQGSKKCSQE